MSYYRSPKLPPKSPLQLYVESLKTLDNEALIAEHASITRARASIQAQRAPTSSRGWGSRRASESFQDARMGECDAELNRRGIVIPPKE